MEPVYHSGVKRHRKLRCTCPFFPIPSQFCFVAGGSQHKRKYEKNMINPASMCRLYHFWYTKVAFSQIYAHTMPTTKFSNTRDLIFSFTDPTDVAPALKKLNRWCCHECVIRKSGHDLVSLSPPFLHLLHSLRLLGALRSLNTFLFMLLRLLV